MDHPARFAFLAAVLAFPALAGTQYGPDDPVPPGATGKITTLTGLTTGLSGKTDVLGAALKDLGARVTGQEIHIELSADVLFDFDKHDLRKDAEPSLQKVASVVKSYPGARIRIAGHTDGRGSDSYNQALSERRANSVKVWLVQNAGADAGLIATHGYGKTRPVVPNTKPDGSDDPMGRQKNRRVEIILTKG